MINNERIQKQVMDATGISHDEYSQVQFDKAYDYLKAYLNCNEDDIRFISCTASFWAWWKLQWALRDERFLAARYEIAPKHILKNLWYSIHKPHNIIASLPTHVLEESYDQMISAACKEEQKKKQLERYHA